MVMQGDHMKVLLIALNARYIHSNLALRYLKACCSGNHMEIKIREFTINDRLEDIIAEIFREAPDIAAFSCYIWNMEEIRKITVSLKKILPNTTILLGGPEVSYEAENFMETNRQIDFIIKGEGEKAFPLFLEFMHKRGADAGRVPRLVHRQDGKVVSSREVCVHDMNLLPDPYWDSLEDLKDKIIYYETSRGCPFSCQYCMSSLISGVRYLPLDRVKAELKRFVEEEVMQVKLVDRTFNANPERACQIFEYIISLGGKTNFHFEMAGHLIDERMLAILKKAPKGLIQLEIGVQSTNPAVLQEIDRKTDFSRLEKAVKAIHEWGNIHLHLDLIAGLPGEDYASFRKSFHDVYSLHPDRLQLGFLKLLKGSKLRENAERYGYEFTEYPPYEVLKSDQLTYEELLTLKGVEEMLEMYGNSHRYDNSIMFLLHHCFANSLDLFDALNVYYIKNGYHLTGKSLGQQLDILYRFGMSLPSVQPRVWKEVLKFDFLISGKKQSYPEWMDRVDDDDTRQRIRHFYRWGIKEMFPHLDALTPRQLWKNTHVECFPFDILSFIKDNQIRPEATFLFFDYTKKGPCQLLHL